MNYVFISPHFPPTYWNFCDRLKKMGHQVFGIGDAPYETLPEKLRGSLSEYYRVDNMEDYDQMVRALGYFTFHYGKIDWLESNNEYWLEQDAALRTDFNIATGLKKEALASFKLKSAMKALYEKAQVPCARYHLVDTLENGLAFIKEVGYPVIVKPDNGVGAAATYKLKNEEDVKAFYAKEWMTQYIMEEFIDGTIVSYDGIADANRDPLFEVSHYFPTPIMDIVNDQMDLYYYTQKTVDADLQEVGRRVIKVFPTNSRFFHCEFSRLNKAKKGLGKKGDIVALEINMRTPGGFTPDMMNFAGSCDVYQIFADMVTFDHTDIKPKQDQYCVFASRRDGKNYRYDKSEVMKKYGDEIKMSGRMPDILSGAMGNEFYMRVCKKKSEIEEFAAYVHEKAVEKDEDCVL